MRAFTRAISLLAVAFAGSIVVVTPSNATFTPGMTITAGNLLFTLDTCSVSHLGVVGVANCNDLNFFALVPPLTPAGTVGFAIQGSILSVGGGTDDVSLLYTIDVIPPPSDPVHDAHLLMVGGTVGPSAVIAVDELITDGSGFDGWLHTSLASPVDSTILLRDAMHLTVLKDILTFSFTPDSLAEISLVDQYFSQVPEPTLMAVVGLGLTGLGLIRRRRKAA